MTDALKDKLAKLMAIVERGGTEAEKKAASLLIERLLNKHNIDEAQLNSIHLKAYEFKFVSLCQQWLIVAVAKYFNRECIKGMKRRHYKRLTILLRYEDWVNIECAYEYFRRHMNGEYKKTVMPILRNCRTPKIRRKMKGELDEIFFSNYIILSNLAADVDLKPLDFDNMTEEEKKKRNRLSGIKGGEFHKQVITTNLLNNSSIYISES
jgi:hypothetical protein